MRCHEFKEIADSYLSDELLVETNHEVLRHLENCVSCRNELGTRRELRAHLREAVKRAPEGQISSAFAAKLEANLRKQASRSARRSSFDNRIWSRINLSPALLATLAVCVILGTFIGLVWWRSATPKNAVVVQQSEIDAPHKELQELASQAAEVVRAQWQEVTRQAVGNHENCGLHHRLDEAPISLATAAERYGKYNKNLEKPVIESLRARFGDKVKILGAHSCVFEGRRFAHIILQRENHTISVLVADFNSTDKNRDAVVCQSSDAFQAACFHTVRQAVFVISDLSETTNLQLAQTLLPAIRQHLEQTEKNA